MTIKPVADRVLIKTVEAEETTQSGICWPLPLRRSKIAEVIAVGPGGMVEGVEVAMFQAWR